MQTITPCLWFNGNAEEAANFYVSIFPNSKIRKIMRSGDAGPGPKGSPLMISFMLDGQSFQALNGGPQYKFTEAVSMSVDCKDQAEVDRYWDALTRDGGAPVACGWLKDKYGLSWQIVPRQLVTLINDSDTAKSGRVMQAMMKMVKIDVAEIERAAKG
ncbi:MAG: VOC family protein [Pseudolabrys sp.]